MSKMRIEYTFTSKDGLEINECMILDVEKKNRKEVVMEMIEALRQDIEKIQDITKFEINCE
jgi:hypothetical protein